MVIPSCCETTGLARLSSSSQRWNIRLTLIRGFDIKQLGCVKRNKMSSPSLASTLEPKHRTSVHAEKITFHSSERAVPVVAKTRGFCLMKLEKRAHGDGVITHSQFPTATH